MQLFQFFSYVSLLALPVSAQSSTQPTVKTLNGTYAGTFLPTFNQDFFGGIPYAQPSRRFVPAQSLNERFSEVKQALNYSVGCVGIGGEDIGYVQGEDCLTVNVIRPTGVKPGQGLPVLVWIHGGAYTMGSSDNIRYNGSFNVQRSVNMGKPIIFASFNYRLTAYGFPVGDEPRKAGLLNLGLKDQRLALHWINENIAAFGGDPSKVTIQGESAGGSSVFQHMLAFGGRNDHLFRGVISQSGYWAPLMASNRAATYNATWNRLLSITNCSDIACLQALPLSTFNASVARVGSGAFNPVVDGDFIKVDPAGQVSDGEFMKVPLIVGANSDEGTTFMTRGINFDSDLVNAILARNASFYAFTSAADVQQILQLYPDDPAQGVPIGTGDGILSTGFQDKRSGAFFGDAVMVGPRRAFAQANSKGAATFSYRFNQPPYHFPINLGATHFAEIAYVFNDRNNNTALPSNQPLGPRSIDAELALLMSSMWICMFPISPSSGPYPCCVFSAFTHDQTPNNNLIAGAPVWPSYGPSGGRHIVFQGFGSGSLVEKDNFREAGIAFINQKTAEVAKAL